MFLAQQENHWEIIHECTCSYKQWCDWPNWKHVNSTQNVGTLICRKDTIRREDYVKIDNKDTVWRYGMDTPASRYRQVKRSCEYCSTRLHIRLEHTVLAEWLSASFDEMCSTERGSLIWKQVERCRRILASYYTYWWASELHISPSSIFGMFSEQ
jgi:hypothetical protein